MLRPLSSALAIVAAVCALAGVAVATAACTEDVAAVENAHASGDDVVRNVARAVAVDAGSVAGSDVVVDTASVAVVAEPVPTVLEREALMIETGDFADHRRLGEKLLREGRSMDAIGEFRKTLTVDASADVWASLGDSYLRVGDVSRGLDCLLEAITVDVDHLPSRRLLARHYLSANMGEQARQQAEEWVRLEPTSSSARQALGRSYTQLGMWREAIGEFTLVLAEQPDNAYAHNNLGFAALQLGDNARAASHLERILSLRPQEGYMLNNLGVAYERLGRSAEAHAAFARAAELSPRYAQAALNRDRLQRGLDQAQRVVSADTLLKLRDGEINDVAPLGSESVGDIGGDGGLDLPAMPSSDGE